MVKIYSVYDRTPKSPKMFTMASMAVQSAKDECDINSIMAKYQRTGFLTDPLIAPSSQPSFGDFATMGDFMEAQNIIAEANQLFDQLPSTLRKRFSNDPAIMLDFLSSEENKAEAIKLGLVKAPDPEPRAPDPILVRMAPEPKTE